VSAAGLLRRARSLLADSARWAPCQGRATALTASGVRVVAGDRRAVRWCALAALQRVAWGSKSDEGVRVGAVNAVADALAAVREVSGRELPDLGA